MRKFIILFITLLLLFGCQKENTPLLDIIDLELNLPAVINETSIFHRCFMILL